MSENENQNEIDENTLQDISKAVEDAQDITYNKSPDYKYVLVTEMLSYVLFNNDPENYDDIIESIKKDAIESAYLKHEEFEKLKDQGEIDETE